METKINIAAILKDKPQGTKLYDWLYNIDIELDTISTTDTETVVWCTNETDNNTICHRAYSEFGTVRGYTDGLQILLPSKEMRDWRKFAWKRGDVLVDESGLCQVIFKEFEDDTYTTFEGTYWLKCDEDDSLEYKTKIGSLNTADFHIDTNENIRCYIQTISELTGRKLNLETLEVKKPQQEFKDGDIKKEYQFKPFETVMVRNKGSKWTIDFYSFTDAKDCFVCVGGCWETCLPFNMKTAKLIGTTDNYTEK